MKERGKAVETFGNNFSDFNYSSASEFQCKKHPNSSSIGVCAHCLKDRLVKLVCSECGEQRLSSCSCSDVSSSYRNSCSTMEIGSVGRISFLLESEKTELPPQPHLKNRTKDEKTGEQVIFLRRSSSSCVEVKKRNGFWKIKRLFRKRKQKGCEISDDKSEIWVSDVMGVSRSRSLCSFRGDDGSDYAMSSAKISDVTSGIFLDSDRPFGFWAESEPRKSGFRGGFDVENGIDYVRVGRKSCGPNPSHEIDRVQNRGGVFQAKESDFTAAMDESAFIDLKLDLSESKQDQFSAPRISAASDHGVGLVKTEAFENRGSLKNIGMFRNGGGSCRITVNEKGLKRGSRSHKVWKWIFKYKDEGKIFNS